MKAVQVFVLCAYAMMLSVLAAYAERPRFMLSMQVIDKSTYLCLLFNSNRVFPGLEASHLQILTCVDPACSAWARMQHHLTCVPAYLCLWDGSGGKVCLWSGTVFVTEPTALDSTGRGRSTQRNEWFRLLWPGSDWRPFSHVAPGPTCYKYRPIRKDFIWMRLTFREGR